MSQLKPEKNFESLISECDQLIRAGKINLVSTLISKLNFAQVPREDRQILARICRRAGLINYGLRLMHPVVRNDNSLLEPANTVEICEYAVLLSRNGSVQEALNLLETIDVSKTAEALMSAAYCHMASWDYGKAVECLEKYLDAVDDPYLKLIAKVNLASSYLSISQLSKAEDLCSEAYSLATLASSQRLAGNCLEIRSQVHIHKGDYRKGRQDLAKASEIFATTESYDKLFIEKWQAVIEAFETESIEALIQFRQVAVQRKHWESVRESDLFCTKVKFEQNQLDYLMHGTPMAAYQARISQMIKADPSPIFTLGSAGSKFLDLKTGELSGIKNFNAGKKIHQTMAALLRDFYVPRNVGTLFSELYPDEYFDIQSSPLKVRQALWRTRDWLKKNKIPVVIDENAGAYRILIQGQFGFRMHLESQPIDSVLIKWSQLQKSFSAGIPFSAEQACSELRWPRTSFRLVVNWALENGLLKRSGAGKSTVYLIQPVSSGKFPSAA